MVEVTGCLSAASVCLCIQQLESCCRVWPHLTSLRCSKESKLIHRWIDRSTRSQWWMIGWANQYKNRFCCILEQNTDSTSSAEERGNPNFVGENYIAFREKIKLLLHSGVFTWHDFVKRVGYSGSRRHFKHFKERCNMAQYQLQPWLFCTVWPGELPKPFGSSWRVILLCTGNSI